MYGGLIFMLVTCSVNSYNIQTKPVKHFTNDDLLFGQTVIQSTEGVYVSSPNTGKLFNCTLENECVLVNSHNETTKGLRPITSLAATVISDDEHLLLCNQVRTKKSSTEYLNGYCTMINPTGTIKLNPAKLVQNQNEALNSNNNNNRYHGGRIKRDVGTEIAFVLDGSSSIHPDDFQRAKDFISKVMTNVWKTCFNCAFAIVQYGSRIRTELPLQDNKDASRTLEKVKEIQQLGNLTKTASAIHYVLTNVFVPENGSKNNSKKMIIVLSDGMMLGDPMNLPDVLNMAEMKEVTRFAIGVGDNILRNPEAVQEMKDIADADKFFNVSSYAALDDILSHMELSITGNADPGTEIAFVLDGSGSIHLDDFQRAKDFICNVMTNVWKTCFNCAFTIVQYGSRIRTELPLQDNKDASRTLEKVKEIQQLGNLTKTASAIHHVLTNVFIPESGSKSNSKKIIIVLSDGKFLGDPMNLSDVLNMPEMKGVTRFAIGVGDALLSNPEAVEEMKKIAGTNQFFKVSNYAALDIILSQVEQSIND
nr:integrin alpha-E-like [Misgurnus anguillicaudatus]